MNRPLDLALPGGRRLAAPAPALMGILNVTPDSFSDGGRHDSPAAAVAHGLSMARHGAAVIDVGGESTRPGATRIEADVQIQRTVPVITALRQALDDAGLQQVAVSIDTTRVAVARAALEAGAAIINDVSAGRDAQDELFRLAADHGCPLVLMHMLGQPATMQVSPRYDDVVADVLAFLLERSAAAQAAGVPRGQVIIDPGLGFGKTLEHNLALLARLNHFTAAGHPVLLGASRKRMIAELTRQALGEHGSCDGLADGPADRLGGTCAITVLAAQAGIALIRVHDVLANQQALTLWRAVAGRSRTM